MAAGSGSRMNAPLPKQFLEINTKPVLIHTIEKFYCYDKNIRIILVLASQYISLWLELAEKFRINYPVQIAHGGECRFHSVKNGLALVDSGIVAIHDAVRPLVSVNTIKNAFETAALKGNAVPVISVNDSLRVLENDISKPFDRNIVRIVQTPQCFNADLIKNAYQQDFDVNFTDDATVLEKYGYYLNLTQGNPENIKITHASDIAFAEALLRINN